MKEQYVKLSDVQSMLEKASIISDDEYCGYCTEDVRICDLPVYEFEDYDTQDKKTVEETERAYKYISESESKDLELIASGLDHLKGENK